MKAMLKSYADEVDVFLRDVAGDRLRRRGAPAGLVAAMEYSLLAGGKRLRPVLCLVLAELFGASRTTIMPFAAALELIHTYSLIHDDLPAMDDDDLRRGRPSNHKVHGEAMAILAGDALLTEAFGLMAEMSGVPSGLLVQAMALAAMAAGAAGMVGGQALDMDYTARDGVSLDDLAEMQAKKTGALLASACLCGAVLAGAGQVDRERAVGYGRSLGRAFQIVDDILDETGDEKKLGKPVGSDREQGKTTYPSLVGLDESRRLAEEEAARAVACLDGLDGPLAGFLRDLARYVVERAR